MYEAPLVCIVILNWSGRNHLEYCLPSVKKTLYDHYELVVVDNASTDDSVAFIEAHFPDITIIRNERNLAWAGGNNVGIRYALNKGASYVALINNDIKVDPRWISEAVKTAQSDSRIGIVGFNVFGEVKQVDEALFREASRRFSETTVVETDNVVGCALFCKAEVFEYVGLMDEIYFMYSEENDFERRVTKVGYKMVRINVPIWHYSEGSAKTMPLRSGKLAIRNAMRFHIKHSGPVGILKEVMAAFKHACVPFIKVDRSNALERRARPSNIFVNFFLFLYAVCWNVLFLPQTLWIRRTDYERVKRARKRLEEAGT